jgi:ABC-type transport system involved in multi-copper enzyme maturation permease subunit
MSGAWVVARMTFLEARRNRIAWSLLFFSLFLVLTSFLFQEVTIASFDRVVRDVGMAAISVFGVLLAIFFGINVVTREIERRSAYFVLAKPIARWEYLLGKLAGVWLTLAGCLALMLAAFLIEAVAYRGPITAVVFQAFWLLLMEILLLASFAILASTFTSSLMAAFMSIALFVSGHLTTDLYVLSEKSQSPLRRAIGTGIYYVLPNLERLNLKGEVSLLKEVPAERVVFSTLYGLLYAAAFLLLAVALFRRRDLK